MRALISGAGVAGPTLAWFLAKAGARVTIVEKNFSALGQGQNIDVNGSALTVIRKMGLTEELRRFHTTEKGTQFVDSNGQPYAPFPVKEHSSVSLTAEFEILRGDLSTILYNATKDHVNIDYHFGITIREVFSNDAKAVNVKFSNEVVQEFDLLVAADGQWSKLRKQCFPPESVSIIDKNMYAIYWTVPRLSNDDDWWNIYVGLQSRLMSIRPDPHGTMRAIITRMPCNDAQKNGWQAATRSDRQTQKELVKSEFADAGWQAQRILEAMDQAPDFYFQAVQLIKMSKWSTNRIICLGDAAWAPTPLTGAGASLAINGAYVLAGELSELNDEEHPSKAFEAFETKFRPWVEESQKISSVIPGAVHPETAWKRWVFQLLLQIASKAVATPWLMKRFDRDTDSIDYPLPQKGDTIRPFAPFSVKEHSSASLTSEFEVLREDLSTIFYEAKKDHPNIDYFFGITIKEVFSNGDNTVNVELSNEELQEFDLLVAADGQWSKLRNQCFPSESNSTFVIVSPMSSPAVLYIDDRNPLVYYTPNSSWIRGSSPSDYERTSTNSIETGATATIAFSGRFYLHSSDFSVLICGHPGISITVYGRIQHFDPGVHEFVLSSYSVDGGPATISNSTEQSQYQFQQKLFQSNPLNPGAHSLIVTHLASNVSGGTDPTFHIDYFLIVPPDSPISLAAPSTTNQAANQTTSQTASQNASQTPSQTPSQIMIVSGNGGKSRSGTIPISALVGGSLGGLTFLGVVILIFWLRHRRSRLNQSLPRPYPNRSCDELSVPAQNGSNESPNRGFAGGLSQFSPTSFLPRRMIPPSKEGGFAQYPATDNLIEPPHYEE
ncbi:hypothetical protein GALMADRAFT_213472 [Galerina marginata CBS 339.88]|uniref:FAD-binding domain-containing protein n=1 Tax=Galerina marginata (strain CBS 339.88) TaxID=685588 RepID=A0A067SZ26_GALM3|nr:hypothetical protein GALMADRAFT_213472 [Galerina marginata CBS 339.88]